MWSADCSIKGGSSQTWPTNGLACIPCQNFIVKKTPSSLTWIRAELSAMANLYLVFDEQATNKTPHIVPKCYDAKQQETNSSSTVTLINYQSADGGIPVNFGLNILGWMVSETLVSVVEYLNLIFLPCFTF